MTSEYSRVILSLNILENRIQSLSTLVELIPNDDPYYPLIESLSLGQADAFRHLQRRVYESIPSRSISWGPTNDSKGL